MSSTRTRTRNTHMHESCLSSCGTSPEPNSPYTRFLTYEACHYTRLYALEGVFRKEIVDISSIANVRGRARLTCMRSVRLKRSYGTGYDTYTSYDDHAIPQAKGSDAHSSPLDIVATAPYPEIDNPVEWGKFWTTIWHTRIRIFGTNFRGFLQSFCAQGVQAQSPNPKWFPDPHDGIRHATHAEQNTYTLHTLNQIREVKDSTKVTA
ncbi:hypothetical protein VNO77_03799 [Canavalia gladiata]|uniref:Uncharacterized protein n=1 Tax=Canavalia gladiata TaxID=3824 RepID=A0AAN9MXE5_CANGL